MPLVAAAAIAADSLVVPVADVRLAAPVAGAIAGPICDIDVRTLYLKDLTLFGCTFQEDVVFENIVTYIEAGEIRPVIAKTYALRDIATAQEDFLAKRHTGQLVLIPPQG